MVLGGLPAKQVRVKALATWWQPAASQTVDLRANLVDPIELRMSVRAGGPVRTLIVSLRDAAGKLAAVKDGCSFVIEDPDRVLLTRGEASWKDGEFQTSTAGHSPRKSETAVLKAYGPKRACTLRITASGYAPTVIQVAAGLAKISAILEKN